MVSLLLDSVQLGNLLFYRDRLHLSRRMKNKHGIDGIYGQLKRFELSHIYRDNKVFVCLYAKIKRNKYAKSSTILSMNSKIGRESINRIKITNCIMFFI